MPLAPSLQARLETQLDSLDLALAGANETTLRQRPPSGKWSAYENLAHLVRHHASTMDRLQLILKENRPTLPSYRADSDPEWTGTVALPSAELLKKLRGLRKEFIEMAGRLSSEQLARVGIHPAFGALSVSQWIHFFLIHEAHHLYVIMNRRLGRD